MSSTLDFGGQGKKWDGAKDVQEVAASIRGFPDLRCLELHGNTLGVEAARVLGNALAVHPEFERAHWKDLFTGRLKTEIPEALRHLFSGLIRAGAKLKELDLSDNALGPVAVEGMLEFMCSPVCYSLEELRLNNNGLGIKGGTMLARSLAKLVENAKKAGSPLKLKVFIAGRNRLEKEGAQEFSKFFKAVGTLEEICMPQNGIPHEGISALAEAFSVNHNLRVINLNDNTFTPKGAKAMAAQLHHMQKLEIIDFGDCLIKTAGAKYLAKALTDNHMNLKVLQLESNEIRAEGGLAIADAMVNKDHLTTLNLDGNQFGEEGRENIVIVLQESDRLVDLGTLENDEEPDSEDEEERKSKESEIEEEEDIQEVPSIGITPVKESQASITPIKCTASEFLDQPTASRLLGLGNAGPHLLLEEAKLRGPDFIFNCFSIMMKVASLAVVNNSMVEQEVKRITMELANAAFISEEGSLSSVSTNSLLVHLGIIKCEDKKFKLEWDLRGCLMALAHLVKEPFFPKDAKYILQFCLSKPNSHIDMHTHEKHKLMMALYQ